MYFAHFSSWAGTGQQMAVPAVGTGSPKWGFAHGESGPGVKTYFQVQNVSNLANTVNAKFFPTSGTPVTTSFQMPAHTWKSFDATPYLSQGTYGALFQSTQEIVVGRTILRNNGHDGDSAQGYNLAPPVIRVSPATMEFLARAGGTQLQASELIDISFYSPGFSIEFNLPWSASSDASWLSCTESGQGSSAFYPNVNITGMARGTYTGTITITAPGAINSPQKVIVKLTIF